MSILSAIGLKKSDEQKAAEAADSRKVGQDAQNAITIANYRLNSKNQYDRLKNNRYAPYQGVSAYAQAAHIPGMSAPQPSVVSLADTGAGAPVGSNAAGWDEYGHANNPATGGYMNTAVHHTGYNEYLNGTANAPGTASVGAGPDGRRTTYNTVDAMSGGVPQTVAPTFMPGAASAQPGPSNSTQAPGTQYKFFPGGR